MLSKRDSSFIGFGLLLCVSVAARADVSAVELATAPANADERIGTPEALAILEVMATGNEKALPTVLSVAAVDRLKNAKSIIPRPTREETWENMKLRDPEGLAATLAFSSYGAEAVNFLSLRLLPLTISAEEVRSQIADLGSDDGHVWRAADDKLRYFDPRLAIDLDTLMKDVTDPVPRDRLIEILCDTKVGKYTGEAIKLVKFGDGQYNFDGPMMVWGAYAKISELAVAHGWEANKKEWTRAVRAEILLGSMNTPAATHLLQSMATGHPDALPTKVAKEMLTANATR